MNRKKLQETVNELVWKYGADLTERGDYEEVLEEVGLEPEDVSSDVLRVAIEAGEKRHADSMKKSKPSRDNVPSTCHNDDGVETDNAVQRNENVNEEKDEDDVKTNIVMGESEAREFLTALNYNSARTCSIDKLASHLNKLPLAEEKGLLKRGDLSVDVLGTLKDLLKSLKDGSRAEVVADEEVKKTMKKEQKTKKATRSPRIVSAASETPSPTKGRGRPRKADKEAVGAGKGNVNARTTKRPSVKATRTYTPRQGVSIVGTMLDLLQKKPISRDDLITQIDRKFPGRDPKTQRATVVWQLATGLPRKGFRVEKNDAGKYFVK